VNDAPEAGAFSACPAFARTGVGGTLASNFLPGRATWRHVARRTSSLGWLVAILSFAAPTRGLTAEPAPPEDRPGLAYQRGAASPPVAPPATGPELICITVKGGNELRGKIIAQDEAALTLELMTGERISLDMSDVEEISVERGVMGPTERKLLRTTAHDTRYLFGHPAMPLKQGNGFLSQHELTLTSFGLGLTDNISVFASSILLAVPFGWANIFAEAMVGGPVWGNVYLAGGAHLLAFQIPGGFSVTPAISAAVTVGGPTRHATLLGAYTWPASYAVSASGYLRLNSTLAIVTENWFIPGLLQQGLFDALALRIKLGGLALDVGGLYSPAFSSVLPWLSITTAWKW